MQSQISIIVPVYNVPKHYLHKCLDSICGQTISDIEIIVVNDGSTDDSGIVCESYSKHDSRITVINKNNEGLSAARNTGFEYAHSKWIMFVDGDDWIEPEMCSSMLSFGELYDVELVMCGLSKDYGNSSEQYIIDLINEKVYQDSECKMLQERILHYNGNISMVYCKLIRRDFLLKNNIVHNAVLRQGAEGIEFNLRLFEYLRSAVFINKPFYHYVYNEGSISATHSEKNHEYVLACFEQIKSEIACYDNKEQLMHWLNNRLLYVIITTAISGYFSPDNKEPFYLKKQKYKSYLQRQIVHNALYSRDYQDISFDRRVTLYLIRMKMFLSVSILARIRKWYKLHK